MSNEANSSSESILFEVEKILDKKIQGGETYYKVKWLGYSISEASWEPIDNLSGAPDIIKRYEKNLRRRKRKANTKQTKTKSKKRIKKCNVNKNVLKDSTKSQISTNEEDHSTVESECTKSKEIKDIKEEDEKVLAIKELFNFEGEFYVKVEIETYFGKKRIPVKEERILPSGDLLPNESERLLKCYEDYIKMKTVPISN